MHTKNFSYSATLKFGLTLFLCLLPAALWAEEAQVFFQAHRGAVDERPENTLEAFRFAWNIPGAVPEVDVRTTLDGDIVCIHDETPKRTCNAPEEWAKKSIREIPTKMLCSWDAGSFFDEKYKNEKVPLLTEVFDLMKAHPEKELYLDVKDAELDALLKLIQEYHLEKQIIFVHGDVEMCKKLLALYPGARTMTWISGMPDKQKERFTELANTNFEGISQLQFHLRHSRRKPEIQYVFDDAYLKEAVAKTRAAGVDLQLRPFLFTPESLRKLVDLGVYWYVADAPESFYHALKKAQH